MVLEELCVTRCYDDVGLKTSLLVPCLEECFKEGGWTDSLDPSLATSSLTENLPEWVVLVLSGFLVCLSGLFAGLTLGLLSLDPVGLRIIAEAGEPREREYAEKIIPVRKHGNLLLCTLLFGNVIVNSSISILLSDLTSGPVGLLASTGIILVIGEVVPQSVCSRHGLMIGAYSLWLVKIFMILTLPINWPVSKLLDWVVGRDVGMIFSQEQLKRLIDLHYEDPEAQKESRLTCEDHKLLIGSLEYKAKRVTDVMTVLESCFMLEKSTKLDFKVLTEIYQSGYSRIPVYEGSRHNIKGVLYVKDLILVDPDDSVELGTIMDLRGHVVACVFDDVTLDKVLKTFMTTYKHLLVVYKHMDPSQENPNESEAGINPVVGLITLEDVLEEVLQDEIMDETDNDPTIRASVGIQREKSMSTFMKFFDHKLHTSRLSAEEISAICAFLVSNVEEFSGYKDREQHLANVVLKSEIMEIDASSKGNFMDFLHQSDQHSNDALVLYKKNVPSNLFSLILQGKVCIRTGNEGFALDMGPWSHLGGKALTMPQYIPDFDAVCDTPCRVLRIAKPLHNSGLDAIAVAAGSLHSRLPVRTGPNFARIPGMLMSERTESPVSTRTPLLTQHSELELLSSSNASDFRS